MICVDLYVYEWAFSSYGSKQFPEIKILNDVFNSFLLEKQATFEYGLPVAPKIFLKKDINNKIITTSLASSFIKLSKNDRSRLIIIELEKIKEIYDKLMNEKIEITKGEYQEILYRLNEVERKLENIHINYD